MSPSKGVQRGAIYMDRRRYQDYIRLEFLKCLLRTVAGALESLNRCPQRNVDKQRLFEEIDQLQGAVVDGDNPRFGAYAAPFAAWAERLKIHGPFVHWLCLICLLRYNSRSGAKWRFSRSELDPAMPRDFQDLRIYYDSPLDTYAPLAEKHAFRWDLADWFIAEPTESFQQHKKRALMNFERRMDAALAALQSSGSDQKGTSTLVPIEKLNSVHLEWVVLYHVERRSFSRIASAPGDARSTQTVRNAAFDLSRKIGLSRPPSSRSKSVSNPIVP